MCAPVSPSSPSCVDGTAQQLVLVTLAAVRLGDVGTHNRPDGRVIDGLHDVRALQLAVVLARPKADPPDGRAVGIADEARYDPRADQPVELLLVAGTVRFTDADLADLPVVDAPATAHNRSAWQVEQLLEVGPGPVRQRSYLKHGCSLLSCSRDADARSSGKVCHRSRKVRT